MRIMYMNGKLYLSMTGRERDDVNENAGRITEIDLGLLKVLHKDINDCVQERFKELQDEKDFQERSDRSVLSYIRKRYSKKK